MTAVQDSVSSIRVTWSPPFPLGITTGYTISYTGISSSSSGGESIDGGASNSYTLTALNNGDNYTVSVFGTAAGVGLPSPALVQAEPVSLGKAETIIRAIMLHNRMMA